MIVAGEHAIVTGGGSGMGEAVARALAARGAKVTIFGRREERLRAVAADCGANPVRCDVSDPDSVSRAFDAATARHGVARVLVHAAAIGNLAPLLRGDGTPTPREEIREVIDTNLLGTLWCAQAFSVRLAAARAPADGQRGVLVNISSSGAADGVVGASYVAAKGGVDALCLSLAREFGPWGIRVVTICPGAFDTEMLRNNAIEATLGIVTRNCVFPKRLGKPEEIASLALHLIDNDFANGCNVRLDAGIRTPYTFDLGGGTELGKQA